MKVTPIKLTKPKPEEWRTLDNVVKFCLNIRYSNFPQSDFGQGVYWMVYIMYVCIFLWGQLNKLFIIYYYLKLSKLFFTEWI